MNKSVILLGGLVAVGLVAMGAKSANAGEKKPEDKKPVPSPCPNGSTLDPSSGLCVETKRQPPPPTSPCPAGSTLDTRTRLCVPNATPKPPPAKPAKPAGPSVAGFDCDAAAATVAAAQAAIRSASAVGDYLTIAAQTSKLSDLVAKMQASGCSMAGLTSPVTPAGCPAGQVPYNGQCVPMEWFGMTPAPAGQGPALPPCPADGSNPSYDCIDANGTPRWYGQQLGRCPPGQVEMMGPNGYTICGPIENAGMEKVPAGQAVPTDRGVPPCPPGPVQVDYLCVDANGVYQNTGYPSIVPYQPGEQPGGGLQGIEQTGGENGGWNPFA